MALPQCSTQFDLMMQLASKRDSAVSILDVPVKTPTKIPQNNFLLDQVGVKVPDGKTDSEQHSRQEITGRSSVTENLKTAHTSMVKDRLKAMQRIWVAMTKFVASQCA